MSQQPEQWPPLDLINGLALEAPPAETELDPNVVKGKSFFPPIIDTRSLLPIAALSTNG
jgi:hypothetical protein